MATPRVPVQSPDIADDAAPQGIQVEVADEFQQVRLPLYQDGLVPVLEEMPGPSVPPVEGPPHGGVRRDRMVRARG